MSSSIRRAMVFAGVLAMTFAADVAVTASTARSDAAAKAWGFDRSDLTPHPDVRFGVLPNGLRYAVMRNAVPAGGLSARLHIEAGATVEGERRQGFMHVIEHLIFEGSTTFPQGALQLMLQSQGLRRFSDFNAVTGYDDTIYRLDLAKSDRRSLETAVTVMREVGGNLLFKRRNVADAKAKVLQEIDARDHLDDRTIAAQNAFFLPGTPVARVSVAGTRASVRRARAAVLERLYQNHYVPEKATLILVGDFDVGSAEAQIAAGFADWRELSTASAPADRPRPPSAVPVRGIEAKMFSNPLASTGVVIASTRPLGPQDAAARRDVLYLEHLAAEMLGRRLSCRAGHADAPFAGGSAAVYDQFATARIARIDLTARNRDWRRALEAGAGELARALHGGFSQAELDMQLQASRSALLANAAARTSARLADGIVDAVGRNIVFTLPTDGSATAAYLASIRLADVNAAFQAAWSSPGRLIFVSHDKDVPNAQAAIVAAWRRGMGSAANATRDDLATIGGLKRR